MFFVSSCSCLCPIYWSHVLSWEWRCSWSSPDRRCSNYIWVINNLIAHKGAPYIRDLTVSLNPSHLWSVPHIWLHCRVNAQRRGACPPCVLRHGWRHVAADLRKWGPPSSGHAITLARETMPSWKHGKDGIRIKMASWKRWHHDENICIKLFFKYILHLNIKLIFPDTGLPMIKTITKSASDQN